MATGDKSTLITLTHNGATVGTVSVVLQAPPPPGPVTPPVVT